MPPYLDRAQVEVGIVKLAIDWPLDSSSKGGKIPILGPNAKESSILLTKGIFIGETESDHVAALLCWVGLFLHQLWYMVHRCLFPYSHCHGSGMSLQEQISQCLGIYKGT